MSRPSTRHAGRRVRLNGVNAIYPDAWTGLEGVLTEKTSEAWPWKITLDNGQVLSLEDWQFEFISESAASAPVQPKQRRIPLDHGKEEVKMSKTATKTRRVALAVDNGKEAPTKSAKPRANLRVAKGAEKKTTRAKDSRPAPKTDKGGILTWPQAVLKAMNGRKGMKLSDIYAAVEKLGDSRPGNPNFKSTVRQTLQALAKKSPAKTHNPRPGVWDALAKA